VGVHLDTHVLLWLSQGRAKALGTEAFRLARNQSWIISPAVILELESLYEIGRIRTTPDRVIEAASEAGDLTLSASQFDEVIARTRHLSWTRDPIDRIITAQAIVDGAKLLTADRMIRANFQDAVWD